MSSEDATVVFHYLPEGGDEFPFPAEVGIPATVGRKAELNARVDREVQAWADREDWVVGRVTYDTEEKDGARRRIGRFTVEGLR